MQVVLQLRRTRLYLWGLRDQTPEMLTSKMFNAISPYLCSCSCQYCYHINQKYCIFFSPKAFCVTQKVLKTRLRLGLRPDPVGELTTLPRPTSRLERGTPHPQSPPLLDGISISAPSTLHFSKAPPKNCSLHTAMVAQLYFWRWTVDIFPAGTRLHRQKLSTKTAPECLWCMPVYVFRCKMVAVEKYVSVIVVAVLFVNRFEL